MKMVSLKMAIRKMFPLEWNYEVRNIMEYLKSVNINLPLQNVGERVFLLDAASYDNLGDQAITYAISMYIKEIFGKDAYVEVSERDLLRNLRYLKSHIKRGDIICLNGGGNMGTLYPRYEAIRRKVIRSFPNNKIIVFPQTIDYENDAYGRKEFRRAVSLYNSHKQILICAREPQSLNIFSRHFMNYCFAPDIVFRLFGRIDVSSDKDDVVGVCLRKDNESVLSDRDRQIICSGIEKTGFNVRELSTMATNSGIIEDDRATTITGKLKEFARCKCIITDRLHGMIFSIIAGVPCLFVDNSNHKVSGVYQTVEHILSGVEHLKNIDKVDENIMHIIQEKVVLDTTKLKFQEIEKFLLE